MSDKIDLIEKLSGRKLNQSYYYNESRLRDIQIALNIMKNLNQQFLKNYQLNQIWNKINVGFIKHSIQISLQSIVEFKLCESNKIQKTFFNPFSKKPIIMCYNKFIQQEVFDQHLNYNLLLYYDWKTKKNINWNSLQQTTLTNIRALNLSGICNRDDKDCIEKELKTRVFQKERFKGLQLKNFSQIIKQGLKDTTPISQPILKQTLDKILAQQ